MIPAWFIALLNINNVGEFSFTYNGEPKIFMDGKFTDNGWVISLRVIAMPHFAWGVNGYPTGIKGSHKEVIRYYLGIVVNQLTEYKADGRTELLKIIKEIWK